MKIKLSRRIKQLGSALLVVMVLGGILCMSVMYYLALVQQQNTLSVRSQAWNIAIAVTEAGVEEGLQALNSTGTPSASDGWIWNGTVYVRTNGHSALGGNAYTVSINTGTREIVSRAYVALPALAANSSPWFLAAAGETVTAKSGLISRAVRVRYAQGGLFLAAMVAKHKIDLKGNGVLADSFDSGDLWKSNFGQYDAAVFAGDNGDVASNDGVVSTISVQNANIYGRAHTGAEGTVTIGSQGGVGTHAWQATHKGSYEDGYVLQDANFTFPNTSLPYNTGLPLGGPATRVTVTYEYSRTPTNTSYSPTPPPWSGVTTNVHYTTNASLPSPIQPGTVTNTIANTSSSKPSPVPPGLVTNTVSAWDNKAPKDGTYVPPVIKIGSFYYFNRITGYSWDTYTYTWPTYSYSYNLYTTNTIYHTNYYDHVINSGDYYSTSTLGGSTLIEGTARLVLPNGLAMSGNDKITVGPSGSIQVFCGGNSCTVGGNGVINQAGLAQNFILQCTESVTSFTLNGNGEFIGVLVAPNANMTMNGGGNSNTDFVGALMMDSINMNGHFSFHYDEALRALKNNPRLLVTAWDEIK